jgi:hypothetical protein
MHMRFFFGFILSVGIVTVCLGQRSVPVTINPKAGINFTSLIIKEGSGSFSNSLSRMGWNGGIDIRYGNQLIIRGGIHYYQLGSSLEHPDSSLVTQSLKSHILKVPVGVGLNIYKLDYLDFWLFGDVIYSYTFNISADQWRLTSDQFPATVWSGRLGAGMDLSKITLEASIERSFTDVIYEDVQAKNYLIQISLGIKI